MATITMRDDHAGRPTFQAKVRKAGFLAQSCTFPTKKEAEAWARSVDDAMTKGQFCSTKLAAATTMKVMLETYRDSVTVKKKGQESETYRVEAFIASPLASFYPANLFPTVRQLQGGVTTA